MKTIENPPQKQKLNIRQKPVHSLVNRPASATLLLAFTLLLGVTACQRSTNDLVSPQPPSSDQPAKNRPASDSTSTPTGSVGVFQRTKITWAPTDFQEIQSDAVGTPVQYTSQYLFIQGTNQVRRSVYQLQYDPDQHLNRVDQSIQTGTNPAIKLYTLYHYEGNRVIRSEDYSSAGNPIASRTYQYSASNQLIQIDEKRSNSKKDFRKTYQYDQRGNLTVLADYSKNPQDGTYLLETTTHFENYDNQKHVENLLTTVPLLPGVRFRVNNYQTKIVRSKDGRELNRETVSYAYNEQGYPTQKTTTGPGGSLTARYSY